MPSAPLGFYPVRGAEPGHCRSGEPSAVDDPVGHGCLELGSVAFTVRQLKKVELSRQAEQWAVAISFEPADAKEFTRLTTTVSARADPQNRVAVVLGTPSDGRLLSAPTVIQPINSPDLMISGGFTRDEAEELVTDLGGS